MNNIASSRSSSSSNTAFNRSSKSPLYLVPANNAPISKLYTIFSLIISGTFPSTINFAKPSTIAVFPTPGSPTIITLFFLRRAIVWAS